MGSLPKVYALEFKPPVDGFVWQAKLAIFLAVFRKEKALRYEYYLSDSQIIDEKMPIYLFEAPLPSVQDQTPESGL